MATVIRFNIPRKIKVGKTPIHFHSCFIFLLEQKGNFGLSSQVDFVQTRQHDIQENIGNCLFHVIINFFKYPQYFKERREF